MEVGWWAARLSCGSWRGTAWSQSMRQGRRLSLVRAVQLTMVVCLCEGSLSWIRGACFPVRVHMTAQHRCTGGPAIKNPVKGAGLPLHTLSWVAAQLAHTHSCCVVQDAWVLQQAARGAHSYEQWLWYGSFEGAVAPAWMHACIRHLGHSGVAGPVAERMSDASCNPQSSFSYMFNWLSTDQYSFYHTT